MEMEMEMEMEEEEDDDDHHDDDVGSGSGDGNVVLYDGHTCSCIAILPRLLPKFSTDCDAFQTSPWL